MLLLSQYTASAPIRFELPEASSSPAAQRSAAPCLQSCSQPAGPQPVPVRCPHPSRQQGLSPPGPAQTPLEPVLSSWCSPFLRSLHGLRATDGSSQDRHAASNPASPKAAHLGTPSPRLFPALWYWYRTATRGHPM